PSGRGTRRKKISECPRHDRPLSKHKSRVEIDLRFSQQCEEFLLERPLAMMLFLTGNVLFWRGVNTWFGARVLVFARRVVNNLVVGNQVYALEYDLAVQIPACVRAGAADNINDIIWLLHQFLGLRVHHRLGVILQHRNFILIDLRQQQSVVDDLGPQVLQRVGGRLGDFGAADVELVLDRNGQFEPSSVAHHVKRLVAHNGKQPDHAQHVRLAHQNVSQDLLVVGDLSLLFSSYGRANLHRGVQGLDLRGFLLDAVHQLLFGGSLQFGSAGPHLDGASAEQASTLAGQKCSQGNRGKDWGSSHNGSGRSRSTVFIQYIVRPGFGRIRWCAEPAWRRL